MELRPPTEPAAPSIEPACEACVYAAADVMALDAEGAESPTPVLECHRFPPSSAPMSDGDGEILPVMMWPQIHPEDWCGEFVPRADE